MRHSNPIHQAIYDKVVAPAMKAKTYDVEGIVIGCNYKDQTVDVFWRDPTSGVSHQKLGLPIPKDGDGIYRQSIKNSDRVRIAFRGGNQDEPYISVVHKGNMNKASLKSKYGGSIPKGIGYL
jgi:hypothetical protein